MRKEENKSGVRQYRKYSKELKEEVCQLAESSELSHKELGAKFEIDPTLISKWLAARRNDGAEAFRGRGVRTELEAELSRLKKENSDLKQEREILKKAAAYFAKHQA
ncbi:MAG: transposase [Pseudomonadota bacterium]|jgi:transposase